jgi:hypothetical protein
MRSLNILAIILMCGVFTAPLAGELITAFKDPSIVCDYLIVAPRDLSGPAVLLAQHRNSFPGDDVRYARVAIFEDIDSAFPDTNFLDRNISLWKGLKWAWDHWAQRFTYIVLIGNDWYSIDRYDSLQRCNYGYMPTWYRPFKPDMRYPVSPQNATDDYYAFFWDSIPPAMTYPSGFAQAYIGRIPAASPGQCSLYVWKVIRFDRRAPRGPWRNSICALADDTMQGVRRDMLGTQHMESADLIADTCLPGFFVTKRYNLSFPLDLYYEKPRAKTAIVAAINRGVQWVYFFGHGNNQLFTDEHVLTADDFDRFTNDSMPFVMAAFTSNNADYFQNTPTMCKRFLFKDQGGAIAYVSCVGDAYASDNEKLGRSLFSRLATTPNASIGMLLTEAKALCRDDNSLHYYLLGDPALRMTAGAIPFEVKAFPDSAPTELRLSLSDDNLYAAYFQVNFTVRACISPSDSSCGPKWFSQDSTIAVKAGVLQPSAVVPIPPSASPMKAIVYVWYDTVEGRAQILLGSKSASAAASPMREKAPAGRITLRQIHGRLMVSNLRLEPAQAKIFDIRGRLVWIEEFSQVTGTISINPAGIKFPPGRYIIQVQGRTSNCVLPFINMGQ